jgi:hypothetical protein
MTNYATEIINLEAGINYSPTFIRTDKRIPDTSPSSLGYFQIGDSAQHGNARGPVFKIEFADLSSVGATHVRLWGLENDDTNAPIYPISYLQTWRPQVDVYLQKFIFCDSNGTEAVESTYSVFGYKRKSIPTVY